MFEGEEVDCDMPDWNWQMPEVERLYGTEREVLELKEPDELLVVVEG